jgi:antirestriction protein ArdC
MQRRCPINKDIHRIETTEQFFTATGATIRHGGSQAFYSPSQDIVQMPELQTSVTRGSYYATLAHEMTHWTRHESRLNRDLGRKRFADAGYAMEELVAEIGAAFLIVLTLALPRKPVRIMLPISHHGSKS